MTLVLVCLILIGFSMLGILYLMGRAKVAKVKTANEQVLTWTDSTTGKVKIKPGWYPTPDELSERYHDGNDWTDDFRAIITPTGRNTSENRLANEVRVNGDGDENLTAEKDGNRENIDSLPVSESVDYLNQTIDDVFTPEEKQVLLEENGLVAIDENSEHNALEK